MARKVPLSVVICFILSVTVVCKSQPTSPRKPPVITYVAGPNQLTLLMDGSAFRFGYDTDDQFRAERRFPNGTVAGYYGYVRADGKPVRVKYGAVDDLGFSAIQEIIPASFPEPPTTTEGNEEGGSGTEPTDIATDLAQPIFGGEEEANKKDIAPTPNEPIVDDERESVSIDAADYLRSDNLMDVDDSQSGDVRFVFPKIDVPDLPRRRVRAARPLWLTEELDEPYPPPPVLQPPIPVQRAAQRRVVVEKNRGEPAIIYAEPTRFFKTASVRFTTTNN